MMDTLLVDLVFSPGDFLQFRYQPAFQCRGERRPDFVNNPGLARRAFRETAQLPVRASARFAPPASKDLTCPEKEGRPLFEPGRLRGRVASNLTWSQIRETLATRHTPFSFRLGMTGSFGDVGSWTGFSEREVTVNNVC